MVYKNYNISTAHQRKFSCNLPGVPNFYPTTDGATNSQKTKETKSKISFFQLFRYSTCTERLMVVFGVLLASIGSIGVPYSIVIYGEFTSLLIDRDVGIGTSSPTFILQLFGGGRKLTNASREENIQAIKDDSLAFGIGSLAGAVIELVLIAMSVDILNRVALKQISRIRKLFLKSILCQEMSWYDTTTSTSFASKMTEDLDKMKEGIGEKIAIFTFLIMTFVTGIVASFFYGWKLTLVVLVCCPFIIISTAVVAKIQSSLTEKELAAYSDAGSVAEEVFSGIRTVLAFGGEQKEADRYGKLLIPAEKTGSKKGLYSGLGAGAMWFIIYCCYAVAMWYGVKLILNDRMNETRHYTPAVLVIVLFGIIMGAQNLGFSSPHIEAFATAKGAAQNVFEVIDRKSAIDSLEDLGLKPDTVVGHISFENIDFRYPSRPDVKILKGFTLKVEPGSTVALVGPSGCGKSTTIQLMQRFYDPECGTVKLDGKDLRSLNVGWLRSKIGVVGQEPVLFATSISENIRYGWPQANQNDIENAAKMANCHDFIMKLSKGYNTMVGERGAHLSGGQKQRIAIARAVISNPKILLLDEATSALDPTSERRVQEALQKASEGRTTLVVAHRLSTITNADKIVFVKDGCIAEEGTHEQLMNRKGLYFQVVNISQRKEGNPCAENKASDQYYAKMGETSLENSSDSEADDEEIVKKEKIDSDVLTTKSLQIQKTSEDKPRRKSRKSLEEKYKISFKQLMMLNAPEWRFILAGCTAAMLHGATFPIWAVLFGDFFGIMSSEDDAYVQSQANLFSYLFIVIGLVAGIGTFTQTYMFNTAGVKMTSRLRERAFKTIINQEVAFFDDERNSVGAICARLAGDCSNVQGATGARVGIIVQALSTLAVGVLVAFIYSWNLTLVTLITVPFVCLSIFFEARFTEANAHAEKNAIEGASQVAVEAISNIRTVASLCQEKFVFERYCQKLDTADIECQKKLRFRGVVFGLGQAAPFIAYGVSLYYGGLLVANENLPYQDIIKVSEALIFGSWMLGQALSYAPNVNAAIISARRLLKLFDRAPLIHNPKDEPYNTAEKMNGDICYNGVSFCYPTRRENQILKDLSFNINSGSTVALVGPSGSGKSTCVQLLLRYYDPIEGTINLSGIPTTDFSLRTLRSKLGLVSQEPVLFDRTIAENIAYGDNLRDIAMMEIIVAAKKANIHEFITSLPKGYETRLGSKGTQLSGGQKQRIAIARALVRDPKILILDEATSALDMESEKVVQEALDKARHGRTSIIIAHRLTTIRDADQIYVLKNGSVAEAGTHSSLMELKGIYYELYVMQQIS